MRNRILRLVTGARNDDRVMVDHIMQTFQITIRSMNGVSPDTLKRVVQNQYEVTDISPLALTAYVHPA